MLTRKVDSFEDEKCVEDTKSETGENVATEMPPNLPLRKTRIQIQCKDGQIEKNNQWFI